MYVGCADHFEAFNINYKDTGMFGFHIACDEVAVEHAVGELMFGANLLSFSVTDEEVERGKRELKSRLFGASGSSFDHCDELGTQMPLLSSHGWEVEGFLHTLPMLQW